MVVSALLLWYDKVWFCEGLRLVKQDRNEDNCGEKIS